MLFRLFKNTNMMALFFVIIAVATCIYSSLTYKCITLFERELNKVKNHVSTMSTTMESMLQNNILPCSAPVCGNVRQSEEKAEAEVAVEGKDEKAETSLPQEDEASEKPSNDVVQGNENQETEDTHSQSSFEDEMLRINEIVTSIQTDNGERGGGGEREASQKNPTVLNPAADATNPQPPADKKTRDIDMNALSQMKYGELQSFVKNRFGVMLRVNKLDMLKKVEEMAASA